MHHGCLSIDGFVGGTGTVGVGSAGVNIQLGSTNAGNAPTPKLTPAPICAGSGSKWSCAAIGFTGPDMGIRGTLGSRLVATSCTFRPAIGAKSPAPPPPGRLAKEVSFHRKDG